MKEYIGKTVKLHLIKNGAHLFYTAMVTSVTDTHITFIDRDEKMFSFKVEDIEEISPLS